MREDQFSFNASWTIVILLVENIRNQLGFKVCLHIDSSKHIEAYNNKA